MELKDFVKETLISIIEGVVSAQGSDVGKHVNPKWSSSVGKESSHAYVAPGDHLARLIKFDVAITVTEASGAEGGGKISILSSKIGVEGHSSNEKSTASKISFEIPITMPMAGEE